MAGDSARPCAQTTSLCAACVGAGDGCCNGGVGCPGRQNSIFTTWSLWDTSTRKWSAPGVEREICGSVYERARPLCMAKGSARPSPSDIRRCAAHGANEDRSPSSISGSPGRQQAHDWLSGNCRVATQLL